MSRGCLVCGIKKRILILISFHRKMTFRGIKHYLTVLELSFLGKTLFSLPFLKRIRRRRYKSIFHLSNVVGIGNHVQIESAHTISKSNLKVGKGCFINDYALIDITGKCVIGDEVIISEGATIYTHSHDYGAAEADPTKCPGKAKVVPSSISIGSRTWIGAHSIILPHCNRIGNDCIVAAGSVVTKDIPDNVVVAGNPATIIKSRFSSDNS